jgi:hypothetical protein
MPNEKRIANAPSYERHDVPVHHLHQIELANRWRISSRTLERWRWLRQGPVYLKIGGRVAYRMDDIEAFETQQARGMIG